MILRAWAAFRREGLGLIGNRVVRFARKTIGRQKLMVYRMPPDAHTVAQRHDIVELTSGAAVPANSIPWPKEEVEARLSSGARLFALQSETRLVSFAWVSHRRDFRVDEIRRELKSETPLIWIWDCVTPSEYRGHGYYPELICHLAAQFGQRDVVIFVRTDNMPSVRGIAKAGFQRWVEIAVTRWSARIRKYGAFDGGLTITS
jgi:hypothetical protein